MGVSDQSTSHSPLSLFPALLCFLSGCTKQERSPLLARRLVDAWLSDHSDDKLRGVGLGAAIRSLYQEEPV